MEAFSSKPPAWVEFAKHASGFCCPACRASSQAATQVWINRRSPVYTEDRRRQWQEFYHCDCGQAWWAWSTERPPSELAQQDREIPPPPQRFFDPFDDY